MNKLAVILICVLWTFISCDKMPENAPTYGTLHVVADETLFPVVEVLKTAFESSYPKAKVSISYLPESQVFQQFYGGDSTAVIVVARQLNEKEINHFKGKNINPRSAIIANDALALLVNRNNPDTNLTCTQANRIFSGEMKNWSEVSNKNVGGAINLVFDNEGSSTVSYLLSKTGKTSMPENAYALKTTQEVINYVMSNTGAIGIIGYNWLSDFDDAKYRSLRSKIKVVGLSPCEQQDSVEFYKPYAANVQDQLYPFSRQVFVINRETFSGLGTGFSAFVAGELGQRIISKTGILPAYKVEHNIVLKSEPFKVKK